MNEIEVAEVFKFPRKDIEILEFQFENSASPKTRENFAKIFKINLQIWRILEKKLVFIGSTIREAVIENGQSLHTKRTSKNDSRVEYEGHVSHKLAVFTSGDTKINRFADTEGTLSKCTNTLPKNNPGNDSFYLPGHVFLCVLCFHNLSWQ